MLTAKTDLTKIIFIKIETVPSSPILENIEPATLINCFNKRFKAILEESDSENDVYQEKAAITPEFGKIAAISWGIISDVSGDEYKFSGRTISSNNEKDLLSQFADKMNKLIKKGGDYEYYLCGYALKGFDVPFIAKRMLINNMTLPPILNTYGAKPWELNQYIDISEAWKMTAWDSYTSMETLCALFNIEIKSSKPEVIKSFYFEDKEFDIIGEFLENKVLAMANLYLKLKGIQNKVVKQQLVSNN